MDMNVKENFIRLWGKYFNKAELPIAFYYTHDTGGVEAVKPASGHKCIFADMLKVRKGKSLCFDAESIGCFGGRRYLGFDSDVMPNFEYFLSCGIPGKMEGERYKKSPELVKEIVENWPNFKAPAPLIIFKRWVINIYFGGNSGRSYPRFIKLVKINRPCFANRSCYLAAGVASAHLLRFAKLIEVYTHIFY
jgi:hypothetical protein